MAAAFFGWIVSATWTVSAHASSTLGHASDADRGQQRRAECATLLGGEQFHRLAVDIGLDLPPERAARSASAETDLRNGNLQFGEQGKRVAQAEGDALHHRADEVGARVRGGDADECGAGLGVEVRRALSEEVRRPEHSIAGGGDSRGLGGQLVVRHAGGEGVSQPAQREARAVGHAHHMPHPRHGVAEGVQAAEAVQRGLVCRGKDNAAGADGGGDRARRDDPHSDRARALIARARGNWRSRGEAGSGGACIAHSRADLGAFKETRQPAHGNACGLGDLGGPAAMRDVQQKGSAGLLHVDGELAGEAIADIILGAEDVRDAGEDFGLMRAHPEQLGEGEVGQRGIAGQLDQPLSAELGFEPVALRLGALVAPEQRGAQHFSRCVEQDAAVHLAGQSHGLDLCAIQFGGSNRARDGLARGAPPVLGLLLRPADLFGADRRVLAGRRRHHAALAVHQHGPRSPRPNIDSQKHRAVAPSIPSLADSISIASKVYPLRRGGCMRAAGNLHCAKLIARNTLGKSPIANGTTDAPIFQ